MKLNNKGFIFVETIVIMSIVMISMLGLYNTSNKFLIRIKEYKRYDDINDVYKLNALKQVITTELSSISTKFNEIGECSSSGIRSILSDIQDNSNVKKIFGDANNLALSNAYIVNTHCLNLSATNRTLNNYLKRIDKDHNNIYLIIEYTENGEYNYASLKVGEYRNE